jgi:hypothetical protein
LIILIVFTISIIIPNLNLLLTFVGAVLGTIINIWLPVLFYNRAYNPSFKNRLLEGSPEEMAKAKAAEEAGEDQEDPRKCIKIWSWIVFTIGTIIGVWGLVYVIMEALEAKEDEV